MSANKLPPFPKGHPFYGHFAECTLTEGWCYGEITKHIDPPGAVLSGDGFAVAPDGFYMGIIWSLWSPEPPERYVEIGVNYNFGGHLGLFEFRWWREIKDEDDLRHNFQKMLPYLKKNHQQYSTMVGELDSSPNYPSFARAQPDDLLCEWW